MYTRILLFASLLLFLVVPSGSAQSSQSCTAGDGNSCSITFSPPPSGVSTGTFDFSASGDGIITFQFDTVLTTFTLTVTFTEVSAITNIDQTQLPGATCITYTKGVCVRYDVSGNVGGPNGTPVRGVDYKGLINVTLGYPSFEQIDIPVFGHDPELDPNFDENILNSYVDPDAPNCTNCEDPTMGGKTPGISSFAALTEPFANGAQSQTVCFLNAVPQNSTSGGNPIVEVSFKLVAANGDCTNGPFLRDKTATLTVGTMNPNGTITFTSLVNNGDANKFHFDNANHVNVQDINTNGLASGLYYVTVISEVFSPVTTTFTK